MGDEPRAVPGPRQQQGRRAPSASPPRSASARTRAGSNDAGWPNITSEGVSCRAPGVTGIADPTGITTASGLKIDAASRRVHLGDREIALTAKEFDVLAVLASHHDKVVPRETLMNEVWDQNWYGSTKTLDVTIGRLRSKLEAAAAGEKVVAIRGVGFRLETGV